MYKYEDYLKNANIIRDRFIGDFKPEMLIVLGTGLGYLAEEIKKPVIVDYRQNYNVFSTSAPGHKARFIFGELGGKSVCAMQGRLHCYEGYSAEDVAFPVRMLKILGASTLILSNAAGCINTLWNVGDIMLINDHIRFMGTSPLVGENVAEFGPRFCDMGSVYTPRLRELAKAKAAELEMTLREGVYMYFMGPQFETPAEIRAARILGADAAGMSTVPEATVARHCGMDVLGFSLMSNMAAGILNEDLSGTDVTEVSLRCGEKFSRLVESCIREI